MDRTHVIYRCWAIDGDLLYVGLTRNPWSRFASHVNQSAWWSEVASVARTRFTTRRAARRYERLAIRHEHPRYNVAHGEAVSRLAMPLPAHDRWSPDEVTTRQALEILGYSDPSTVTRYVQIGKLIPSRKLPGKTGAYLFQRADVAAQVGAS